MNLSLKNTSRIHRFATFIDRPIVILVVLLGFIVFVAYTITSGQEANRQALQDVATSARNTETIVKKQDETLAAIKITAEDNRLLSEQKTNIIICMLQVPVDQRTTDTVANCRRQVETPATNSRSSNTNAPAANTNPSNAAQTPVASADEPSAPAPEPEQPDNEGIIIDLPLLPRINIPSPL